MRFCVYIFLSLLCVIPSDTADQEKTEPVATSPEVGLRVSDPVESSLRAFQASNFYRTIIDNNLFRPLGWTQTRPRETYRLIGTLIPRDGSPPKALLQKTTGQQTNTFRIGEKVDANTTVVDIQPKRVILETDGQHRTFSLAPHTFLTPQKRSVRRR